MQPLRNLFTAAFYRVRLVLVNPSLPLLDSERFGAGVTM